MTGKMGIEDKVEIYKGFSKYYQGDLEAALTAIDLMDGEPAPICLSKEEMKEAEFDFNRLFVGPQRLLAPPYASVYLSEDRLIMQQETLEVRKIYAMLGLQVGEINHIPDDFLGYELYFLSAVLDMVTKGKDDVAEAAKELYYSFLQDHVMNWAGKHFDRVAEQAATEFNRCVNESLKQFLLHEAQGEDTNV